MPPQACLLLSPSVAPDAVQVQIGGLRQPAAGRQGQAGGAGTRVAGSAGMASEHLGQGRVVLAPPSGKACLSLFRFSSPSCSSSVPREGCSPLVSLTWKASPARTLPHSMA